MSKKLRTTLERHKKTKVRFPTMIYTLFGAYIIPRGGEVHVANLITLVRPLGFSANAIRLGLSRISRHGVFKIRKIGRQSHYSLSAKGMKGLEQGRVRAFDTEYKEWDGKWHLVAYNIPETLRVLRDKFRAKLHVLGFANLSSAVWISPHDFRSEILRFMEEKRMAEYVEIFKAEYKGLRSVKEFAARTWDINDLENRYRVFVRKYTTLRAKFERMARTNRPMASAACFAERFCLTAEYVALRLEDPMLPLDLLPADWVGLRAHRLHDAMWAILEPTAENFVDSVLQK